MKRLTKKSSLTGYTKAKSRPFIYDEELVRKLGKLEDLEEELGCPIEVIAKALKNGIYTYYDCLTGTLPFDSDYEFEDEFWHCENIYFGVNPFGNITLMFGYKKEDHLELSDYKKTWWLRKDKSE